MKAVSPQVMRELDRGTIASGIAGERLMERAGEGAFREIYQFMSQLPSCHAERLLVLCGKGNNGGDGYVVARLAAEAGLPVTLISTCPLSVLTGDALLNAQRLPDDVVFHYFDTELPKAFFAPGTVVVDALLGTGISGQVKQPFADWIEQLNSSSLPVVALDIPSGLNGDTGEICGHAVVADMTITMGLPKTGLFLEKGSECCGRIRHVDIGLLPSLVETAESPFEVVTHADIAPFFGRRSAHGHKRTFGRLAIVGGSSAYTGAPLLAGEAALRAGCGLSIVYIPESAAPFMHRNCSALIVRTVPDDGAGHFSAESVVDLHAGEGAFETVVFGCGITSSPAVCALLGEILAWDCSKVIDADGLRLLASCPELLQCRKGEVVLTPHPGEMKVLVEQFCPVGTALLSRSEQALVLARDTGCIIILKGVGTIIASPDGGWAINSTGRNSLATAGTGDVLAGFTGGLLAQGIPAFQAAQCAVYLHGLAGELSFRGDRALIADDLLQLVPEAMYLTSPIC